MMQRVVAGALLSNGKTIINNPCYSEDCTAALALVKSLGAIISLGDSISIISKSPIIPPAEVFCGESGLGMRMFTPILSLFDKEVLVSGAGSLKNRTMDVLESVLPQLGAVCSTNQGMPPIRVKGPLMSGCIALNGSITSQVLSGLLMALPVTTGNSKIKVNSLKSRGYIDLTIQVLKQFGVAINHDNYTEFHIQGNQRYTPCEITIEGDWSGSAFHLVGAAISGKVSLTGLRPSSSQPDKKILQAIESAGAIVRSNNNIVTVEKEALNSFTFDASDCPDLFPPLAALAANCTGTSIIKGIDRLVHKESNRALTINKELTSVGIEVMLRENEMRITGGAISGGTINSHSDHRIAMMGAILAVNAKTPITIVNSLAINKSYPDFFQTLNKLGIHIEEC